MPAVDAAAIPGEAGPARHSGRARRAPLRGEAGAEAGTRRGTAPLRRMKRRPLGRADTRTAPRSVSSRARHPARRRRIRPGHARPFPLPCHTGKRSSARPFRQKGRSAQEARRGHGSGPTYPEGTRKARPNQPEAPAKCLASSPDHEIRSEFSNPGPPEDARTPHPFLERWQRQRAGAL